MDTFWLSKIVKVSSICSPMMASKMVKQENLVKIKVKKIKMADVKYSDLLTV